MTITSLRLGDMGAPLAAHSGAPPPGELPPAGSRKRKAYRPRNSGDDFQPARTPSPAVKRAHAHPSRALPEPSGLASMLHAAALLDAAPRPAAAVPADAAAVDAAAVAPPAAPPAAAPVAKPTPRSARRQASRGSPKQDAESLAATRARRTTKRRFKYDAQAFDLSVDGEDTSGASADSGGAPAVALPCAPPLLTTGAFGEFGSATAPGAALAGGGAAAAAVAGLSSCLRDDAAPRAPRTSATGGPAAGATDEQRMFQEFRKQACMAYTGVVVHCQNMKLEARVNMVSYVPERERKISGGQVYIAYMTNPHQAAIVHDITASIMTAPGLAIYHNQQPKPSANHDVSIERLNYLDTLAPNLQRGGGRFGEREMKAGARTLSAEEQARRSVMLSAAALRKELHQWVAHDGRWLTFRAWIEDVLFESKLASMCLMPKIIDDEYLTADELALLSKHAPSVRRRCDPPEANAVVYTHTYDSLVMERNVDSSGRVTGFTLLRKCYRRRKPELRSHCIKWVDDKSTGLEVAEPATAEDQRRIDIAWGVVQHWLRHHSDDEVPPVPPYDPLDANYHATWAQFAQWLNALLQQAPAELQALAAAQTQPIDSGSRGAGLPRVARSTQRGAGADVAQKMERLAAVYHKFRALVPAGTAVAPTWQAALPEHRRAFENFFQGWKPLPPSMSGPHGKGGRRGGHAHVSPRPTAAAAAAPLAAVPPLPPAVPNGGPNTVVTGLPPTSALSASAPVPQLPLDGHAGLSLWAMSRGLGAAVPPLAPPPTPAQMQHAAAVLGLRSLAHLPHHVSFGSGGASAAGAPVGLPSLAPLPPTAAPPPSTLPAGTRRLDDALRHAPYNAGDIAARLAAAVADGLSASDVAPAGRRSFDTAMESNDSVLTATHLTGMLAQPLVPYGAPSGLPPPAALERAAAPQRPASGALPLFASPRPSQR